MPRKDLFSSSSLFVPGEVIALLTPLQELEPGLYLLSTIVDDWVVLRWVIDDEEAERVIVTEREARLPTTLLRLFMPVGLNLSPLPDNETMH